MVIIFGANGMLGRYVSTYFQEIEIIKSEVTRKELDIFTEYKSGNLIGALEKMISSLNPTYIINCAGIINKRPEISIEEMFIVNSYFPVILGEICSKKRIILIHPTTDCVFSGTKGNYKDTDTPDCKDAYGISKYLGEQIPGNHIIIRTSIIGLDKDSRSLMSWAVSKKGKLTLGFKNHFWNGITCLEYAKILANIVKYDDCKIQSNKLVQITSKNNVTKCKLLEYISEIYKLDLDIISVIKVDKVDRTLKPTILTTDIKTQLEEMYVFDEMYGFI